MQLACRSILAVFCGAALSVLGCAGGDGPGASCGNGSVETGETCDDGNRRDGDGCSAACHLEPSVVDCAGAPGGAARLDHCGACTGGTTGVTACTQDCAGAWGGQATLDGCGACVGGTTGRTACAQDCAAVWGGEATLDRCGACVGGTTGATACVQDCAGTWGGQAALDRCGACVGGATGRTACAQDCAGVWGGQATLDRCGACVGGTTGETACVQDCAGTWGGQATLDRCGACVGGTTGATACAQDCAGTWGGQATLDRCGACTGGTTGQTACAQDCAGTWGGQATLDRCDQCVGGTTGRTACAQDCTGTWGGQATLDRCGACVGGTTGATACAQDCASVWGGSAAVDACDRCTGGTTSRVACASGVCRLGAGETIQQLVDNPACAVVEVPAGSFRGPITVELARMNGKLSVEVRGDSRDGTVFGGAGAPVFRVHAGAALRLRGLAIRGASSSAGVAVYNEGLAVLDDVAVADNSATVYGAILNQGQMEIRGSVISGNVVPGTSAQGLGGAIYNSGALFVGATAITGNRAIAGGANYGGGVCNDGGSVAIEDSDVSGNVVSTIVPIGGALEGGGIFSVLGSVDVQRSRIHHNRVENAGAGAHGGGISAWGSTIRLSADSDVSFNEAIAEHDAFGAGIYVEQHAQLRMDGATVEGNLGRAGVGLSGAAVMAVQASLSLSGNRLVDNRLEVVGTYPGQISGGVLDVLEGTLTMVGGQIVGNTMVGGSMKGGVVRVAEYASPSEVDEALWLEGVEIAGNVLTTTSQLEGGLIAAVGSLRVKDCDVHSNSIRATGSSGVTGGLVAYRERVEVSGAPLPVELVVEGTRFEGNVVAADDGIVGGLVHLAVERTGPVVPTVRSSTFLGNAISSARGWIRGGLFYLEEPRQVRFSDAIVSSNTVDDGIAGGTTAGAATIHGGVLYLSFTSGLSSDPDPDGLVELVRTDVSRNRIGTALATDAIDGGVLMLYAPWHASGRVLTLAATSTTFSGNAVHARSPADGGFVQVFNKDGADVHVSLSNVTLALNEMDGPLGAVFDFEYPPSSYRPAVVSLRNTILSGNTASGADCPLAGPRAQTVSYGYNLLGEVSACPGTTLAATDRAGLDPLFGTYGENGGGTYSLPISAASPAVDGGDPAGCVDANGVVVSTDQRALPRPSGDRCDIGAFEVQAP